MKARVIGGGLAGSEAALVLADAGIETFLFECRPLRTDGAHKTGDFGELVCSDDLGPCSAESAGGMLKQELKDSFLIKAAIEAGRMENGILYADRKIFAENVTSAILKNPLIHPVYEEAGIDPSVPQVIAAGPLVSSDFYAKLQELFGRENVFAFDAKEPLIRLKPEQIQKLKDDDGSLLIPASEEDIQRITAEAAAGKSIKYRALDDTMNFLKDRPSLEMVSAEGPEAFKKKIAVKRKISGKNTFCIMLKQIRGMSGVYRIKGFHSRLTRACQERIIRSVPVLEQAEILEWGLVHKNSYINSPALLSVHLEALKYPGMFFAGQLAGSEGYCEAIASGFLAGKNLAAFLKGEPFFDPGQGILSGLAEALTIYGSEDFQPAAVQDGFLKEQDSGRKS